MAASDMMSALMELCQEKHIDQLYLIDRLEQSLAKSYAEILHLEWGAKVTIDRTTGKIYVYRLEPIDDSMDEEGNFTEFEEIDVTPKNTSRIAAQHAKAEINAIVRNSAREQIYEEFSGRIGDLISGTVLQSTPDFTIVKIREGVEAELPHFDQRRYENERNERPMGERYLHNQHIKAVIIDVRDPNSNLQPVRGEHSRPPIVISRTHPELMRRLFEQEVPEIYEGTVQIKSIAREPGQRSKVAVHSLDDRLDPGVDRGDQGGSDAPLHLARVAEDPTHRVHRDPLVAGHPAQEPVVLLLHAGAAHDGGAVDRDVLLLLRAVDLLLHLVDARVRLDNGADEQDRRDGEQQQKPRPHLHFFVQPVISRHDKSFPGCFFGAGRRTERTRARSPVSPPSG